MSLSYAASCHSSSCRDHLPVRAFIMRSAAPLCLAATTNHHHAPLRARLSRPQHTPRVHITTTPTPPGVGCRRLGHCLPRLAEDTMTGRSVCCKRMF
jgi:hypothetical protein